MRDPVLMPRDGAAAAIVTKNVTRGECLDSAALARMLSSSVIVYSIIIAGGSK